MHRRQWFWAFVALAVSLGGCGGGSGELRPEQWRQKLRQAMEEPVGSRDARDAQSRLLLQAVEEGDIDGLTKSEVRAAFGKGKACRIDLCSEHGFRDGDWYYEIGQATSEDIEQLPILIVGFERDMAVRVWTLTTH